MPISKGMFSPWSSKKEVLLLFLIQIVIIVLTGLLMTYGPEADAKSKSTQNGKAMSVYPLYQDVHVMIFIGFGFLMTFLKKYGQSAVGLTFLIGAVLVQVALLCKGVTYMMRNAGTRAPLSLESLLSADVAVAAPLISMGALLGKTTYMQLICMGIIELIVYTINKEIGENTFQATDAGDSMYVHAFGAYFGLAVSFVLGKKDEPKEHHLEGSNYQSDIFAMIGTVFLWLYWPSFNSASLHGDDQQRAIINTLLSIAASCVMAFATSALISKDNKFNMVHVQNSTLAGGVAIGTAAGMMCEPIGALVIGCLAGVLSVVGYKYLSPAMQRILKIHDTCGVHNLHGMPGVLAGLFGALMAGLANLSSYDYSLYEIFPARAPRDGEDLTDARINADISPGVDRTAAGQAAYQLLTLLITLLIAIVSGLITGMVLRAPVWATISERLKFDDKVHWDLQEDEVESSSKNKDPRTNEQVPMEQI